VPVDPRVADSLTVRGPPGTLCSEHRLHRGSEVMPLKCHRCQHENEPGSKFCEKCAAPLAMICTKCGWHLSATARFCPQCAHPAGLAPAPHQIQRFDSPESYTPKHLAEKILISRHALEGERKQVTVLFADLRGSLELLADRDPEEAQR